MTNPPDSNGTSSQQQATEVVTDRKIITHEVKQIRWAMPMESESIKDKVDRSY